MNRKWALAGWVIAMACGACGDGGSSTRVSQAALVVGDELPQAALVRQSDGWTWVTREQALWGGLKDDVFKGVSFGALRFKAQASGSLAFSTWTSGNLSFSTSAAGDVEFSTTLVPSIAYDPSVGFAQSCDLAIFCDIALWECQSDQDCSAFELEQCYAEVRAAEVPRDYGAYACIAAEYYGCMFSMPNQGRDSRAMCAEQLAASGLVVDVSN